MAKRLYILMRTDMISMNPGKGMAQAAHAANAAVKTIEDSGYADFLDSWREECESFGTTIVLGVPSLDVLFDVVDSFNFAFEKQETMFSGTVYDPTYPLKDGNFTHLIPVTTCGWVLCDEKVWAASDKTKWLELHP